MSGSGFRVQCVPDPEFQGGACLDFQLGSKHACVRVPYEALSVRVSSGRSISFSASVNENILNYVEFLKKLAPFSGGKGISLISLLILLMNSKKNSSYQHAKALSIHHFLGAGVHLGHSKKEWFPYNAPFL